MDRLTLHAWIERLVTSGGHDEAARAAVAEFGRTLRRGALMQLEAAYSGKGDTVAGQTPEHGAVQIEDRTAETKERSFGQRAERIGHYKVSRQLRLIVIRHFWKADLTTMSEAEPAEEWVLSLDRRDVPEWFGERGTRTLFALPLGPVRLMVSRDYYVERWGAAPGREHPGAITVHGMVGL